MILNNRIENWMKQFLVPIQDPSRGASYEYPYNIFVEK